MRVLVTGASGAIGSNLLQRLASTSEHKLRGTSRTTPGSNCSYEHVPADLVSGAGLDRALQNIDAAYYLVHSMEPGTESFIEREQRSVSNFIEAAQNSDLRRVIYLGGLLPGSTDTYSDHLRSRLAVEEAILSAFPDSLSFRASIIIGAESRSFRFIVKLLERLPIIPIAKWGDYVTSPVDIRDVTQILSKALDYRPATADTRSLDISGPEEISYRDLLNKINDLMLTNRTFTSVNLPKNSTLLSQLGTAVTGEQSALIKPLLESLSYDLLPSQPDAATELGVSLHSLDAAIESALGRLSSHQTR